MFALLFLPLKTGLTVLNTLPAKTVFRDPSNGIQIGQIPGPSLHKRTVPTDQLGQFTKQSPLSISLHKVLLEEMLTGLYQIKATGMTVLHSQWDYNNTWFQLPVLKHYG